MRFRLTVCPALEAASSKEIDFFFETAEQMIATKDACAYLLLFMQDEMKIMPDYSNSFGMEELIDGEWEEYEEF